MHKRRLQDALRVVRRMVRHRQVLVAGFAGFERSSGTEGAAVPRRRGGGGRGARAWARVGVSGFGGWPNSE